MPLVPEFIGPWPFVVLHSVADWQSAEGVRSSDQAHGVGEAMPLVRPEALPARLRWLGGQYTCRLSDEGAAPESLRNLPWLRNLLDYEYSRLRYNFSTLAPAATAARLLSMHTTCNYDYRGHGIFNAFVWSFFHEAADGVREMAYECQDAANVLPMCCQRAVIRALPP